MMDSSFQQNGGDHLNGPILNPDVAMSALAPPGTNSFNMPVASLADSLFLSSPLDQLGSQLPGFPELQQTSPHQSGTVKPPAKSICKVCGKGFQWSSSLALHMRIHTGERPFSCPVCKKTFTQKVHMQRHLLVHKDRVGNDGQLLALSPVPSMTLSFADSPIPQSNGPPPLDFSAPPLAITNGESVSPKSTTPKACTNQCQYCQQSFGSQLACLEHTYEQHKEELPVGSGELDPRKKNNSSPSSRSQPWCDICSKRFSTPSALNMHMRIHTGERPYVCSHCGKAFSQSIHLRTHMTLHTGRKPYVCPFCAKGFAVNNALKVHMMIHTGERPHTCKFCGKSFVQRSHLLRHVVSHIKRKTKEAFVEGGAVGDQQMQDASSRIDLDAHFGSDWRSLVPGVSVEDMEAAAQMILGEEAAAAGGVAMEEAQCSSDVSFNGDSHPGDGMDSTEEQQPDTSQQQLGLPENGVADVLKPGVLKVEPQSPEESQRRPVQNGEAHVVTSFGRIGGHRKNRKSLRPQQAILPAELIEQPQAEQPEQQPSSSTGCANCACLDAELQLMKSELSMVKQFLSNKLGLMEYKIDNLRSVLH